MSSCIARASLWRRLGQSSGPYTGPVVNLPRPERRLAVHSTAIRVVNQSESIYKILKPVLALAHLHRVKLHMYIDDSLLNPGTRQEALEQTSWLSKAVTQEVDQLASLAEGFTAQQSPPAVQWLQVLGHLVSLEKLVPYGRIRIRPIQWQLRFQWGQLKEKSSKLIPLDLQSRLAILGWPTGTIYEGESQ